MLLFSFILLFHFQKRQESTETQNIEKENKEEVIYIYTLKNVPEQTFSIIQKGNIFYFNRKSTSHIKISTKIYKGLILIKPLSILGTQTPDQILKSLKLAFGIEAEVIIKKLAKNDNNVRSLKSGNSNIQIDKPIQNASPRRRGFAARLNAARTGSIEEKCRSGKLSKIQRIKCGRYLNPQPHKPRKGFVAKLQR